MSTSTFAKTHNLIAYLEKPIESDGFKQIIDFLNGSSVKYALHAKTTSWNKFSSTMASAFICLATNHKFNFLRYILLSLVKNIEAGVPFFMFPSDEDSLKLKELMDFCANLSNKVLDLESELIDIKSTYQARIKKLETRVERLEEENRVLKELKSVHSTVNSDELVMEKEKSSKQVRKIADINADVEINVEKAQAEAYNLDLDHQEKVLRMLDVNNEKPADVEEVLKVVKVAKLITKVVTTAGVDVNAASVQDTPITIAEATKVSVPRKRRGVIIQDPKETIITVTVQPKVQAKDKEKAILIEEPKPLKRQTQIELDEDVARQLEAELNADINWNAVIDKMLENFDREDLESLWNIIRERFAKTEPKNYSDDFLLNTLEIMFEKPNVKANIFLLVERMYPLTRFTLEQMINDVRLEVEDESEMSLELLRLVRKQLNKRPRTSIHGQILADFITKRSDEDGPPIEIHVEEAILDP
uniref:DED domain-containing protein n=1 Tax=Tanacetum cinerariifolium TaxID=118510 RepID=A0A6L2NYP0_TANCI|nr:hypothetical protein [Tanacetum cinerariifolium]